MSNPRSLNEWLSLLEQRHPREIELGLDRIASVAASLDLAPPAPIVISVAGTNGKGSCIAAMEALLLEKGLRVGCYTSPHLLRYNERILIQGEEAADSDICRAFERIEAARGDVSLTYFEFGTLAALLLMADCRLDVALLEVGLGGRLDAVNLVDANVAVITGIALDHTDWLGDSREAIAIEKAGIARPGQVLVCGDADPPRNLRDHLLEIGADTRYIGTDFGWEPDGGLWVRDQRGGRAAFQVGTCRLPLASLACAVQALTGAGIELETARVAAVLPQVSLRGRLQRLCFRNRQVVLDVAHNPQAVAYLAEWISKQGTSVHGVMAIMADKDAAAMTAAMDPVVTHWYAGSLVGNPRALAADALAALLYNCASFPDVADAFLRAVDCAGEEDTVLVFGSFFTVARILEVIEAERTHHE